MRKSSSDEYAQVASDIYDMPPLDNGWREKMLCANPPAQLRGIVDGLTADHSNSAERNASEKLFIRDACGRCAVQWECFVDAVANNSSEDRGYARGGHPGREIRKYVQAYNKCKKAKK